MDGGRFQDHCEELKLAIAAATERFFAERGIPFDPQRYCAETSIDYDQLVVEAHTYGADLYPMSAES